MNKKMKGVSLLTASIASSFAMANYVIVVSENYETVTGYEDTVTSEWLDVGSASCSNDIETSDKYYGESFQQTETCNQNQERTVEKYFVDHEGNRTLKSTDKESKVVTTSTTNPTTGTHLEASCKDVLSNGYSKGTGNYVIQQSGNPTVYCDMTRNGGGWMRVVNHNWYENKTAPNSQFDSTNGKTIHNTSNVTETLPDAFWVKDWAGSAGSTGQRWVSIDATPIHAWTESMIDFDGLGYRSLDGWAPSSGLSSNVNGQYLDGFSVTYGNSGSRKHLHSFAIGHKTYTSYLNTHLSWIGSDYSYGEQSIRNISANSHQMVVNGLKKSAKTLGRDMISLRLMADQHYADETIGFRKYIVWVR